MRRAALGLVLGGLLLSGPVARADGERDLADWPFEDLGDLYADYRPVSLRTLLERPESFRGLHVSFECRFGRPESVSMPFFTRFRAEEFFAMSIYPLDARLWTEEGYAGSSPIAFANKEEKRVTTRLMRLQRFERFRIFGQVQDLFAGLPWIEIQDVRQVDEPIPAEADLFSLRTALRESARGRTEVVIEILGTLLRHPLPGDMQDEAQRELGRALLAAGRASEAVSPLRAVADRAPGDLGTHRSLAEAHAQTKAWPQSARVYREAAAIDPRDLASWMGIARAEVAQGNWEAASIAAGMALAVDPRSGGSWRVRGEISVAQSRWADAARSYETAIDLEAPGSGTDHRALGNAREEQGDMIGALAAYERARSLDASHVEGLHRCARVHLHQGGVRQAEERWREALALDGAYLPALEGLARLLLSQERWADAAPVAVHWAQTAPRSVDAHVYKGVAALRGGQAADAVGAFRAALELQKANGSVWALLAQAHVNLGENIPALEAFVQAERSDSAPASLWNETGRLRQALGDPRRACADFQESERRSGAALDGNYAVLYATALGETQKWDEAFRRFEALAATLPNDVRVPNNHAWYLLRAGRNPAQAVALAARARELAPANAAVRHTYGWALLRTEQAAEAVVELRSALEASPGDAEAASHLAEALVATGSLDEAEALVSELERRGGESARASRTARAAIRAARRAAR